MPDLAAEWHPEANGSLLPDDVRMAANQKVWWLCRVCTHEWLASPLNRSRGTGCPVCAGRVVMAGRNDLATVNPAVAAQWHPTANGDVTPRDVSAGSGRKVWWLCATCGAELFMSVVLRSRATGCRYCRGAVNSVASRNPGLAGQWHPTRNGDVTAAVVSVSSSRKVWWQCRRCLYSWQRSPKQRTGRSPCPACKTKLPA